MSTNLLYEPVLTTRQSFLRFPGVCASTLCTYQAVYAQNHSQFARLSQEDIACVLTKLRSRTLVCKLVREQMRSQLASLTPGTPAT